MDGIAWAGWSNESIQPFQMSINELTQPMIPLWIDAESSSTHDTILLKKSSSHSTAHLN
jgi:hypothetical protein